MTAKPDRPRNGRGQGTRLRDEILAAAESLIDSSDPAASLSLRGVARAAGISAPSIYSHFSDVGAIEDALLARGFADLDAAVAEAMNAAPLPEQALVAGCLAYLRFAGEHRRRYRFMVAADGFAPDAVATFARIEAALRACVVAGASTSTDPHADAFLLWVGMHGMATLDKPSRPELLRLGPLDRPAMARTLIRRLARLSGSE